MVGLTAQQRADRYGHVNIYNHLWEQPGTFRQIGVIPREETRVQTEGRLAEDVPVAVNKMILNYDQVLLLGVSLPHGSAGFGGDFKHFFPGISG